MGRVRQPVYNIVRLVLGRVWNPRNKFVKGVVSTRKDKLEIRAISDLINEITPSLAHPVQPMRLNFPFSTAASDVKVHLIAR